MGKAAHSAPRAQTAGMEENLHNGADVSDKSRFPSDFLWGVATSAYQIEGSPMADGAGPHIWHEFSRQPGRIGDASTGDVACDHYRLVPEDIALMHQLGVPAYRFSFGWARVLPEGRGRVNPKGLAFYDRLLDHLLSHGIVPFATLYHWDLPLALEHRGGWLHDDVAYWFGDYCEIVFRAYGDRIPYWVTINEPGIITEKGYVLGTYAPGHRNPAEAPMVARNLLRAHGVAVQACRSHAQAKIGITVNLQPKYPASDQPDDVAAVRRADAFRNRQFLDPIYLGRSPDELPVMFGDAWRPLSDEDLRLAQEPTDFLGVNYYTRNVVRHDPTSLPTRAQIVVDNGRPRTLMGWEVFPEGLTEVLRWVATQYGNPPVYITENGAAFADPVATDGTLVPDPARVAFLREHLQAALRARAYGCDLRGYFVWSLLDNFEWNSGYLKPFGIVQVDFATQRRTLKESARFYADVIKSRGEIVGMLD